MKPTDNTENFAMVRLRELDDVLQLVGERRLELRDIAVLQALIAKINWRTGRSETTANAAAQKLKISHANCRASISRLRREGLVVWVVERDSGRSYYLVTPSLAFSGTAQQRGLAWQQFKDALAADLPDGG